MNLTVDASMVKLFAQDFLLLEQRLRQSIADIDHPDLLALRVQFYGEQAGRILIAADAAGGLQHDSAWIDLRKRTLNDIRDRLAAPGQYEHIFFVEALQRWLNEKWPQRLQPAPGFLVFLYDHNSEHRFYLMLWPRDMESSIADQRIFKRHHAELYACACRLIAEQLDPALATEPAPTYDCVETDAWSDAMTKKAMRTALGLSPYQFKKLLQTTGIRQESRTRWRIRLADLSVDHRRRLAPGPKRISAG